MTLRHIEYLGDLFAGEPLSRQGQNLLKSGAQFEFWKVLMNTLHDLCLALVLELVEENQTKLVR